MLVGHSLSSAVIPLVAVERPVRCSSACACNGRLRRPAKRQCHAGGWASPATLSASQLTANSVSRRYAGVGLPPVVSPGRASLIGEEAPDRVVLVVVHSTRDDIDSRSLTVGPIVLRR